MNLSSPRLERAARAFFAGHLGLIAFSTVAMLTVLNGPPGPWVADEPNATIMRVGWKFSGPTYVLLGALAAIAHAWGRLGARRALMLFVVGSTVSLGAELLGTGTDFPFGEYRYSGLLGYRVAGLVPFPIPISWFYMIYGCLAICGRLLLAGDDNATKWRWAAFAGLVLVAWDVSMDPAMVKTAHWAWGNGEAFTNRGFPALAVAFFSKDIFYGMPLSNWFGWYLTGTLIARLMLALVPPTEWAALVSPSRFPALLYAANGVMPIALCFRDELWWAAVLGTFAMAVPVALSFRPATQRRSRSASITTTIA